MLRLKTAVYRIAFLVLALSFFTVLPLSAQGESSTVYVVFDFMKSAPGVDFVEFEAEYWAPIHAERKKRGQIVDWFMMSVAYPSGDHTEYNYICVTVFTDYMNMEEPFPDYAGVIEAAHPGMDMDKLDEKTNRARSWVKSEVFYSIASADEAPSEEYSEWVMVNYMKVREGSEEDYVDMELDYFLPIHQAHVDAGQLDDWMLMGRGMPYGASYDYQFMTVDVYGSWENVFASPVDGVWEEVHPDVDATEIWKKMSKTRKLMRGELWHAEVGID